MPTTKYHDCIVHMHRPASAGGDRTVRVRVTETEIRAYGAKDPQLALERIARARAARKLYGQSAFFNYEAQYPHRGQIFVPTRKGGGSAAACTPVVTLRVEEI